MATPENDVELGPVSLGTGRPPVWAVVAKWAALVLAIGIALYVTTKAAQAGHWVIASLLGLVAIAILAVYATGRSVPLKYLLPGMILALAFQVWPIAYTVLTSFTNYGDGHTLSKEDATRQNIAYSVREVSGAPRYQLTVAVKEGEPIETADVHFLLVSPDKKLYDGTAGGLDPLSADGVQQAPTGKVLEAPGYTVLNARQVNARKDIREFAVPTSDGGGIKAIGLSEAFEGRPTLVHDEKAGTLTDTVSKEVYVAKDAEWVPRDGTGQALPVGWKENVGLKNFTDILGDQTIRSGFLKIFGWNVVFAVVSVGSTFVLGMFMALLFNEPRMRGRGLYRSILILPYAIPAFVTALVWGSMYNQDFGLINSLTGLNVDWLGNPWAAKVALLLANLWLGFPYFFIICTGALQSIPTDVMEAARVDGASAWRRLRSITFPLLLVAVGPLMIASFAFNFNNFGLVWLITEGGPFVEGDTTIGSTDLLITYAFRLAFSSPSPNFGLASAISIFIFVLVALFSIPAFRRTRALEEIH